MSRKLLAQFRKLLPLLMLAVVGCSSNSGGRSLEQALAPDPQLEDGAVVFGRPVANQLSAELPQDFPKELPLYPGATLQQVVVPSGGAASSAGKLTRWQVRDGADNVSRFYQLQFQDGGWQLLAPATARTIAAQREDLLVTVTVLPSATDAVATSAATTSFTIEYSRIATTASTSESTISVNLGATADSTSNQPTKLPTVPASPITASPSPSPETSSQLFSDLDTVPPALRQAVMEVAQLGVLQLQPTGTKANDSSSLTAFEPGKFEPGKVVTRRDYARWLVAANNRLYRDRPAQQIRLGTEASQPIFQDVPRSDPDFAAIQGLAEAGIIPSPLAGQGSALFRPNDPLTREQMLLWKVPLDTRQALPAANVEAIKQTWGFQDANQIEPRASRAVLADFQNGDLAVIRRVFGYTTLFRPKKAVTRAEAAASLWYFGSQTEGVSAEQALTSSSP
ncbi:MAG: S-layer homology domain-containing protein [Cyanobacteria bacterium]|nr:S-layer homology domain-containing protein [Cyanobacteriota bacterium]MDW8201353.1 S-layer homology domain-containing protein [Cyanobacteriota bacterium SKYGB_h_bin112]